MNLKTRMLWAVPLVGVCLAVALGRTDAPDSVVNPRNAETARLIEHFEVVEQKLLKAEVSHLRQEQRQRRAHHVQRLATYRHAQRFPHHHGNQPTRTPYFVDPHGTLCAMAFLIAASGHEDLVRLVQERANTATIYELATHPIIGPQLATWLEDAGLSIAEAAQIQPLYEPIRAEGGIAAYTVGSIGSAAINVFTVGLGVGKGATGSSRAWLHGAGMMSGFAGIGLGVARALDEHTDAVAVGNFLLGFASVVVNATSIGLPDAEPTPMAAGRRAWAIIPEVRGLGQDRLGFGVTVQF